MISISRSLNIELLIKVHKTRQQWWLKVKKISVYTSQEINEITSCSFKEYFLRLYIQRKKLLCKIFESVYTVKPVHAVTSIKQSPVLKVQLFLCCHRKFQMH